MGDFFLGRDVAGMDVWHKKCVFRVGICEIREWKTSPSTKTTVEEAFQICRDKEPQLRPGKTDFLTYDNLLEAARHYHYINPSVAQLKVSV